MIEPRPALSGVAVTGSNAKRELDRGEGGLRCRV